MSFERGKMSRKRPTQVELERQNSELKKQVQQLQKRLKQALRQLRNDQDIQLDISEVAEAEAEASFQDMLVGKKQEAHTDDFIIFQLHDGSVKKIRKKLINE